jgi:hypothetical protein
MKRALLALAVAATLLASATPAARASLDTADMAGRYVEPYRTAAAGSLGVWLDRRGRMEVTWFRGGLERGDWGTASYACVAPLAGGGYIAEHVAGPTIGFPDRSGGYVVAIKPAAPGRAQFLYFGRDGPVWTDLEQRVRS